MSIPLQKTKDFAQHVDEKLSDPVGNPIRSAQRTVEATKKVIGQQSSQMGGPNSRKAQRVVFAKGVFDVVLSLSLVFVPWLLYDGWISRMVSKATMLPLADSRSEPHSAFALASLIMGAGVAGIAAAESSSDDAFKVMATLNGVFAFIALSGCLLSPQTFGSSFLLLAGLQDVVWFASIVKAGRYDPLETLGLSWKAVSREEGAMKRREEREVHKERREKARLEKGEKSNMEKREKETHKEKSKAEDSELNKASEKCEFVAYCSKECQTKHWTTHKPQCKLVCFQLKILDLVRRALEDPKILHYFRVAIAVNGNLPSYSPDKLATTMFTSHQKIILDPSAQATSDISTHLINEMFKQNVRPEKMKLPSPNNMEILRNVEGYLKFDGPPPCNIGGGSDVKDATDLYKLAKETQRRGYYPHDKWTAAQEERYAGKMGVERVKNPVVVIDWWWDNYVVQNAIEITPEAMRDAKRRSIDPSMQLDLPSGEVALDGSRIRVVNGICGLNGDINAYIRGNASLNLKEKMNTYDKKDVNTYIQENATLDLKEKMSTYDKNQILKALRLRDRNLIKPGFEGDHPNMSHGLMMIQSVGDYNQRVCHGEGARMTSTSSVPESPNVTHG
ncbi:hypothetical protein CVT24_004441 [Panaeolus cyanescens]|uniref:MYND-type domain-containing protein n=1 Tax=Panaeolus cyanescens TaxID=181874 RepID=A0A409YBK8_9AGAR|nr:hypothetical protein CVT24_004441 [Panaeolus cyanescens]